MNRAAESGTTPDRQTSRIGLATGPRAVVIATFLSLSIGFLAGYMLAPRESATVSETTGAAPHAVGAEEYSQLGIQSLEAGDFATAERYFERAAELAPESAGPHADLAVALMYQERWEEAHGQLEIASGMAPETPDVYFLQGVVYRDGMNDPARARAAWERFLALVPEDSPQASTVRGWLDGLDNPPETTP
jgi:tetratricopeptide (TPR) repeat protein